MSSKKTRITKKLRPLKPVQLTDAEREMFRREDYVGLEYYHCNLIRRRKRKTPEQSERLAQHDAEHERVHRDPEKAMREAHQALDVGSSLLLKLIHFGKLTHSFEPTEQGKAAGIKAESHSDALMCLASRISYLNSQLIRLAEDNAPGACRNLWFQAKKLTEGFIRLATVHPGEFREVAQQSLTMPSLRARSPKFTADAYTIVAAIHLAEKHPSPDVWDNKSRVGALCHLVVVSIIENIRYARQQYEWEQRHLRLAQKFHEAEYRDATIEDLLRSQWHPTLCEHVLACASLPPWEQDASAWWKNRVLPMVKEEFRELAKSPSRNPALWAELKRGGERNSENDMRRYMEKICKNKFDQMARTAGQNLIRPQKPRPRA